VSGNDATILVLFDGECGFCSRSVRFLAEHDPANRFRFAPLQSPLGRSLRAAHALPEGLASLVVIDADAAYTHSSAVLRLLPHLPPPYRWLATARHVPRPIRDTLYRFVARHRRRLLPPPPACPTPSEALRSRMIG
jgi:predicted DCC family thiol-disulfide oxidoreductase YuxK